MISYIRHNSVFDLGLRTGVSSCEGLYAELDDVYSKFINPQVRVQYETNASSVDCLCNLSGKQTLSNDVHAFIFQNGLISVTVDEDDNVTVAEVGSSGGVSGLINVVSYGSEKALDETYNEIVAMINAGVMPFVVTEDDDAPGNYYTYAINGYGFDSSNNSYYVGADNKYTSTTADGVLTTNDGGGGEEN